MTANPQATFYERLLGGLQGEEFQDEVCARLASLVIDFQRVPPKPAGDGGLDGLSHGHAVAYCCYGPQQEPFKLASKGLREDIIRKFKGDLLKLFELSHAPRTQLKLVESAALPHIIAQGVRIKHVNLVCNWFESHRIIGPIATAFETFKKKSANRFVDANATMKILGPRDLARMGALDEHTMFRAEHRAFLTRVKAASAAALPPVPLTDFDAKFDDLRRRGGPSFDTRINSLQTHFRNAWASAIALDNELAATSLGLHEVLEEARAQAVVSAQLRSSRAAEPFGLIDEMRREVEERLGTNFSSRLGTLTSRVADGEVGRLIGDCHLDWRQ